MSLRIDVLARLTLHQSRVIERIQTPQIDVLEDCPTDRVAIDKMTPVWKEPRSRMATLQGPADRVVGPPVAATFCRP